MDIELPHTDLAILVYYIIATAEASSNLSRYDGIRYTHRSEEATDALDIYFKSRGEGFGAEVKRRFALAVSSSAQVTTTPTISAHKRSGTSSARTSKKLSRRWTPSSLRPPPPSAFKLGERMDDPITMYLSDIFTINVNLAGYPALSVPCGFTGSKLPIGLHLIGQPLKEDQLFSIAHSFEQRHDYWKLHPEL